MFQNLLSIITIASTFSLTISAPVRREVPQEHSHNQFLATVRSSLNLDNPDNILDPVFGLLGNAAAAQGAGKITDLDCLQQATADQAFTNAKAANDVNGQVAALIYRALERNTGKVGLASNACTTLKAVNPEIAAIQQHQDPASPGAAATNKAIVLELAKQIASVGGDPQDAIKSGTFKPGSLADNTGKGNTCDTADDTEGCIFSQNLLVEDASATEIADAVGTAASATSLVSTPAVNVGSAPANGASSAVTPVATEAVVTSSASANLQKFTGACGAIAPPVNVGGRGFVVSGEPDSFLNLGAAVGRSCDVQHNQCANIANSATGKASGLTVGQCDQQDTQCRAAN